MHKVYIIDDDPILQKIMLKMVMNYNPDIDVKCFEDGKKAIEGIKVEDRLPDLLFLDINMPVMNAWQFIDAYKELELERVPIYILSSSIDKRDIKRAEAIDLVVDYLVKPMKKEVLNKVCKETLDTQD